MPSTLDIFAGAGGLSLGFEQAGFEAVGAIEADRFAAQTYAWNFPHAQLVTAPVEELGDAFVRRHFSGVDLVIGGPPCQGFSVAGPLQYGVVDARNDLILQVPRIVKALKPRAAVIENVRGILRHGSRQYASVYQAYCTSLERLGYLTKHFILQAAHFGVPQYRERVFIISARDSADLRFAIPALFKQPNSWRTVSEAIDDLPALPLGGGSEDPVEYPNPPQSRYQLAMRKNSPGLQNHVAMKHTVRVVERFRHIRPGQSILDVSTDFGQRARGSHKVDERDRFKMNNTRLRKDSISPAVTGNFQATHLHPRYHRVLTAREGARLQSFPDTFRFTGPRTLMSLKLLEREGRFDEMGLSQYKQIGNAVPPLMARAVARKLLEAFDRRIC